MAAADLDAADVHDGVRRMEFPVGALVGLLNPAHVFNNFQRTDQVHVHPGGVAHQAHDRLLFALGKMRLQPHAVKPVQKVVHLCLIGFSLQDDDHRIPLLLK